MNQPSNKKETKSEAARNPPFGLVRPRRHLPDSHSSYLREFADASESGEISAFAVCAIGPSLSTWRGLSRNMTRTERINLIGQLHLLIDELTDRER